MVAGDDVLPLPIRSEEAEAKLLYASMKGATEKVQVIGMVNTGYMRYLVA